MTFTTHIIPLLLQLTMKLITLTQLKITNLYKWIWSYKTKNVPRFIFHIIAFNRLQLQIQIFLYNYLHFPNQDDLHNLHLHMQMLRIFRLHLLTNCHFLSKSFLHHWRSMLHVWCSIHKLMVLFIQIGRVYFTIFYTFLPKNINIHFVIP